MKLSEAMLKGCQISNYISGCYADVVNGELCACALGAAILGMDPIPSSGGLSFINNTFNINLQKIPAIPNLPLSGLSCLFFQITEVSDNQLKTREEIAKALAEVGY